MEEMLTVRNGHLVVFGLYPVKHEPKRYLWVRPLFLCEIEAYAAAAFTAVVAASSTASRDQPRTGFRVSSKLYVA
jgi:hypothetical protein